MPPPHLSRRRRVAVLLICSMSLFLVGLDITIVNVALPTMGHDLRTGISGLQWTVDAYTVVMASLLLLAGSMADRFGRRRTFVTGLVVFSIGSLLCSLAPSVELLVAARVVQAAGGAMLNPVAMSIITNVFTEPRERAQAVGIWAGVFGLSMAFGPLVGGAVVAVLDWRAVFLINLPVGLVAIALTVRFVPESRAPRPRRFDPLGQGAVVALLATLTFGIIEAPSHGWTSPPIVVAFATSALALAALLWHEPRRAEPLVDLRFFRSIPFTAAIVTAVAAFAAFGGFLFLNTLYLQEVRALSALEAGVAILPMALMTAATAPVSGRIVGRRGPRLPLTISGVCLTAAGLALTGIDAATPYGLLIAVYAVFGLGFGLVNAPITNAAVSGMPRAQAGVAAALATTSRQVGQTLGVAVAGAIAAADLAGPGGQDLAAASRPVWWTLAVCGALVLVLGIAGTSRRAEASARRTAATLNPEALPA